MNNIRKLKIENHLEKGLLNKSHVLTFNCTFFLKHLNVFNCFKKKNWIKYFLENGSIFLKLFKYSYKVKITSGFSNFEDISTANVKTYQDLFNKYFLYYQKNDFLEYQKQLLKKNLDTYFKLNQRKIKINEIIRFKNININLIMKIFWMEMWRIKKW